MANIVGSVGHTLSATLQLSQREHNMPLGHMQASGVAAAVTVASQKQAAAG